jgi:hypothetical protein
VQAKNIVQWDWIYQTESVIIVLQRFSQEDTTVKIELSLTQFRRLLDLAYVGNWVFNSTRGTDRIHEYDEAEALLFKQCLPNGITALSEVIANVTVPSRAFVEGGIHEAILDYEYTVFYEILAEELARRDMEAEALDDNDEDELNERIEGYIEEFEKNGIDNIVLNGS